MASKIKDKGIKKNGIKVKRALVARLSLAFALLDQSLLVE
jgi:hypothetical protein